MKEHRNEGLMGYYYADNSMQKSLFFGPMETDYLSVNYETIKELPDNYHSVKYISWEGELCLDNVNYPEVKYLNVSENEECTIWVNNRIVTKNGIPIEKLDLSERMSTNIVITYSFDTLITIEDLDKKNSCLVGISENGNQRKVCLDELNFKVLPSKLRQHMTNLGVDTPKDTDGDGIPDDYEINGYTVKDRLLVAWEDSFSSLGYIKYISSPYRSHTSGDPYTDLQKARRDIDRSNDPVTYNPMVAAYPNILVAAEQFFISENKDMSEYEESEKHAELSTTFSVEASSQIGTTDTNVGLKLGYSRTSTSGWSSRKGKSVSFNTASASYLNVHIRYYNLGTGSIYEVRPTTTMFIEGGAIATILATDNTTALSIEPSSTYPDKHQNPINLNSMGSFQQNPISLNQADTKKFLNGSNITMETNQANGHFMIVDSNGGLIKGGTWAAYENQILNYAALITLYQDDEQIRRVPVAAKDMSDPDDRTPILQLGEAIVLAFPDTRITRSGNTGPEGKGLISLEKKDADGNWRVLDISKSIVEIDEYTKKRMNIQSSSKDIKKKGWSILDFKIEAKMKINIIYCNYKKNITIKTVTDNGAEEGPSKTYYFNYGKITSVRLWTDENDDKTTFTPLRSIEYGVNQRALPNNKIGLGIRLEFDNKKLKNGVTYRLYVKLKVSIVGSYPRLHLINQGFDTWMDAYNVMMQPSNSSVKEVSLYNFVNTDEFLTYNFLKEKNAGYTTISIATFAYKYNLTSIDPKLWSIEEFYVMELDSENPKIIKTQCGKVFSKIKAEYQNNRAILDHNIATLIFDNIIPYQNRFTEFNLIYKNGETVIKEDVIQFSETAFDVESGKYTLDVRDKKYNLPIDSEFIIDIEGNDFTGEKQFLTRIYPTRISELLVYEEYVKKGNTITGLKLANVKKIDIANYLIGYEIIVRDLSGPQGHARFKLKNPTLENNQVIFDFTELPQSLIEIGFGNMSIRAYIKEGKPEAVLLFQNIFYKDVE